jgi:hypothetical protein
MTTTTTKKTKTPKTEKALVKEELSDFDSWTPEQKQAWATKQLNESVGEGFEIMTASEFKERLPELFPEEDVEPSNSDLILGDEGDQLTVQALNDRIVSGYGGAGVDPEFDRSSPYNQGMRESCALHVAEHKNAAKASELERLKEVFDTVKTVQGIVSISRVTTSKAEGWKCIHKQLLDKEGDAEVTTTASTVSDEVGRIFNDLVPDLIELGGLDKVIWDQAEITKVCFPVRVKEKITNLVICGVNPGGYGKQPISVPVTFMECPADTQAKIQRLELAISVWLEWRILEAKKRPLQTSLFDLPKPSSAEISAELVSKVLESLGVEE